MNLFATSACPAESARWLDDARVVNGVRETAQLVSAALHAAGLEGPYRHSHPRHPVTLWVQAHGDNFLWAVDHLRALRDEHRLRFPRSPEHRSFTLHAGIVEACSELPRSCPASFRNSAANASLGLDFTHVPDVHAAYRAYLRARWASAPRPPRWTAVGAPWFALGAERPGLSAEASEATTDERRDRAA